MLGSLPKIPILFRKCLKFLKKKKIKKKPIFHLTKIIGLDSIVDKKKTNYRQ